MRTPKAADREATNQSQTHSPSSSVANSGHCCLHSTFIKSSCIGVRLFLVCLQCVSRSIKGHRTLIPGQCEDGSRGIEWIKSNEGLCVVLPLEQYIVPFPLFSRAICRIWLRRRYQVLIHGFRNEKKLVPRFSFTHIDGLRPFGNELIVGQLTDRPSRVHDDDKDDTMKETPITKEFVDRNRDLTLHLGPLLLRKLTEIGPCGGVQRGRGDPISSLQRFCCRAPARPCFTYLRIGRDAICTSCL